jgi:hypothetical protein
MDHLEQEFEVLTMKRPLSDEIMWESDRVHMRNRLPIFSTTELVKTGTARRNRIRKLEHFLNKETWIQQRLVISITYFR